MGKKKSRSTRTSKGERHSISRSTVASVRRSVPYIDKALNKLAAWKKGRNPWISVDGLRIRANSLYGDPRKLSSSLGVERDD
jgi:hypothetical protein